MAIVVRILSTRHHMCSWLAPICRSNKSSLLCFTFCVLYECILYVYYDGIPSKSINWISILCEVSTINWVSFIELIWLYKWVVVSNNLIVIIIIMIGCCVWCILSVYMFYCCMRWKLYRGSHIWIFPFVIWIDWVGNIGWIEALNSDCRFVLSLRSMAKIDVRIEFKPHQRMLNVWWVMMICGVSGVCCVALCMSECEWFYVQCGLYASDVEFKSYCCTTMSILIPLGRQQRQCLYAAADCDFELMRCAIVCYIIKADEQQTKITSTTIVCVCVVLFSIFSDFQCDVESFLPKKTASEQNIINAVCVCNSSIFWMR